MGTTHGPRSSLAARPLHRIGDVRQLEGISRRTVAENLEMTVSEVKRQERPTCDLPLSELYEWSQALHVPAAELLAEVDGKLSEPIAQRAKMVRVMKTAGAILEASKEPSIHRLADTLVKQLLEIMPELAEVKPWNAVGARAEAEYGIAAERVLPMSVFVAARD